jgi:nucleoside 2-deoxyribosyltransferase
LRLYICGPISRNPAYLKEFKFVEDALIDAGHTVCNPTTLTFPNDSTWVDYMKKDLIELLQCDGVAIIHTNQPSKGQALEMLVANQLNIPCKCYLEFIDGTKGAQ